MMLSKRAVTAFVISFVVIGTILVFFYLQGMAQSDLEADLSNRLVQAGVPVAEVNVKSHAPLSVDIVVQSSSDGESRTSDDFWNKFLAKREAALSYKYGHRIDSFTLVLEGSPYGDRDSAQYFLYPHMPSQKPYQYGTSKLDDEKAKKSVFDRIELYGLSLDSLNVSTGIGSSDDVQLLELQLATPDIPTANQALGKLIPSMRPFLTGINKDGEGRIAVSWVKLIDSEGKLLVEHLFDVETQWETWFKDKQIENWYGGPRDIGPPLDVTSTPAPTVTLPQPYP